MFDIEQTRTYFRELLDIDSTTGQFREIQNYLVNTLQQLGCAPKICRKGGVYACLGGEGRPLVIAAHVDDIGLMVRHVNADGTLNVCSVGGLYPFYCMTENVRVYTRDGKVYTGTVCRTPNSIHVTEDELRKTLGDYRTNVCVTLDLPVKTAEDTRAYGIDTGDIIALDHRMTESGGYIKSRFIDDKACAAVLLSLTKELLQCNAPPRRKVHVYFSMYEEIGHGTSWLPEDTEDMIAIDIAPTGPQQNSDEHKVTLFAKDSRFPYHWELTNEIRAAAEKKGIDYVMDIFTPHYGTDDDTSLVAGYDIRHAAIGPGTGNSHGYERTHWDALEQTFNLLKAYLELG